MAESEPKVGGKCPTCGKPTEIRYRPFCSQRCQQLDLGRWFNESYRIAAKSGPGEAAEGAEDDAE
jgi:hypothetical protein